jgi:hypothetical protein
VGRIAPICTAIAVLTCCVACGGGSSGNRNHGTPLGTEAYKALVGGIQFGPDVTNAQGLYYELVGGTITVQSYCAAQARKFADALHRILAKAEALSPPADAQKLHDEFVAAAGDSVKTVDQAVSDIEAGQLACGTDLKDRIHGLKSTERAQQALGGLANLGYAVVTG